MASETLGIDVGGSSVKAARVDVLAGRVIGNMHSVATPRPSTPAALVAVLRELARSQPLQEGRIGVAFPSVVKSGVALTAANIDHGWIGIDAAGLAAQELGRPVLFLNDADAAGLAEMRWGAGRHCAGVVIMLTFGTGIGTALFSSGRLLPNTELGHMELRGLDAEKRASAQVRTLENLSFEAWSERVNEYLAAMEALFWPDLFVMGGAVSERFAEFAPLLRARAQLLPAQFGNQAGVIGAALAASDEQF
jgi:polyphosphate glucokinase